MPVRQASAYDGNRIVAALVKGVTPQDPSEAENGAPEETVPRYRFFKKRGTRGRKSTAMRQ